MPPPRRQLPPGRSPVPWGDLRQHTSTVFGWLQAGWAALDEAERREVTRLVRKSRGRPRNLSRNEAQALGRLAGKAAYAARRSPRRR